MTLGAITGRFAYKENMALWLGRAAYTANEGTVYVLDQKMSKLLLDYDPGEGYETHLPAGGGRDKVCSTKENQQGKAGAKEITA